MRLDYCLNLCFLLCFIYCNGFRKEFAIRVKGFADFQHVVRHSSILTRFATQRSKINPTAVIETSHKRSKDVKISPAIQGKRPNTSNQRLSNSKSPSNHVKPFNRAKNQELLTLNWSTLTISEAMSHIFHPKYYYPRPLHSRKEQEVHLAKFLLTFYSTMTEDDVYSFLLQCKRVKIDPINIFPIRFLQEKLISCFQGGGKTSNTPNTIASNSVKKLSMKGLDACLQYLTWVSTESSELPSFLQFLTSKVEENEDLVFTNHTIASGFPAFYNLHYTKEVQDLLSALFERLSNTPRSLLPGMTYDQYAMAIGGLQNLPFEDSSTSSASSTPSVVRSVVLHLLSLVQPVPHTPRSVEMVSTPVNIDHRCWTSNEITAAFYGVRDLKLSSNLTSPYLTLLHDQLTRCKEPFTGNQIMFIMIGLHKQDAFHPIIDLIHNTLQEKIKREMTTTIRFNRNQILTILRHYKPILETSNITRIQSYETSAFSKLLLTVYEALPLDHWFFDSDSPHYYHRDMSDDSNNKDFFSQNTIYREIRCLLMNSIIPFHWIKHLSHGLFSQWLQVLQKKIKHDVDNADIIQRQGRSSKQRSLRLSKDQVVSMFELFTGHQSSPIEQPDVLGVLEELLTYITMNDIHERFTVDDIARILGSLRFVTLYDNLSSIGRQYNELLLPRLQSQHKQWEQGDQMTSAASPSLSSFLSMRQIVQLITGISGSSSDRLEVQSLLRFLTPLVKQLNLTSFFGILHAMPGMSSDEPIVISFLSAITAALPPAKEFGEGVIGQLAGGYYGLKRMSSKEKEVIAVLKVLNDQWEAHTPPKIRTLYQSEGLGKAMSSMMIGLSNMNPKDHDEVKRSLQIVSSMIPHLLSPMSSQLITNCVSVLATMSADCVEVRSILKVLTSQIHLLDQQSDGSSSIFTVDQIRVCLSSIQHMERHWYKEVEDFIFALQLQISKLKYGYEQYFS